MTQVPKTNMWIVEVIIYLFLICIFLLAVVGSWLSVRRDDVREPYDCFDDEDIYK